MKIIENTQFNRINLQFDEKPSKEILQKLKDEGWRYSPQHKLWYPSASAVENSRAFAESLQKDINNEASAYMESMQDAIDTNEPGFNSADERLSALVQNATDYEISPENTKVMVDNIKQQVINENESILEAIWNIFIPISSGGVKIDETLLETLPDNRINVLSIHQSKGLEFPLVIVDVGSKFNKNNIKTQNLRFPKLVKNELTLEERIRKYSELGQSKRSEKDKSFDDLTRRYFVAFSRAEKVLILIGLNSAIEGYVQKNDYFKIPNVALGWSRDENYIGFKEIYLI